VKQNKRFASFSGKRRVLRHQLVFKPHGSARSGPTNLLRSRTNAFCFFFWKKKSTTTPIGLQTPWVCQVWVNKPSAKQNYAFCFFFWKKKISSRPIEPSAKQNKRLLLLILEKEEYHDTDWSSNPWVGFAKTWVREFLRSRTALFASFSGKRRYQVDQLSLLRSRTNAFCFFFWKKKISIRPIGSRTALDHLGVKRGGKEFRREVIWPGNWGCRDACGP
jgi:hypothetical protein